MIRSAPGCNPHHWRFSEVHFQKHFETHTLVTWFHQHHSSRMLTQHSENTSMNVLITVGWRTSNRRLFSPAALSRLTRRGGEASRAGISRFELDPPPLQPCPIHRPLGPTVQHFFQSRLPRWRRLRRVVSQAGRTATQSDAVSDGQTDGLMELQRADVITPSSKLGKLSSVLRSAC